MEPITTLTYILAAFFGYYIGSDMWNYIKNRSEFEEIKGRLDDIKKLMSSARTASRSNIMDAS